MEQNNKSRTKRIAFSTLDMERERCLVWLPHRHRPAAVTPNSGEGGHGGWLLQCFAGHRLREHQHNRSKSPWAPAEPQDPKQGAPRWPPRPRHGHSSALRSGRSGHGTTSKTAYTSPMHLLTSRRPHNTDPHSHNGLAHRRA